MPDMRVLKTKARQSDRRQTPSFSWGKALCSCYIIPERYEKAKFPPACPQQHIQNPGHTISYRSSAVYQHPGHPRHLHRVPLLGCVLSGDVQLLSHPMGSAGMEPVQPRKTEGAGRTTGTSAHIVALDGFQLTIRVPGQRWATNYSWHFRAS